MMMPVELPPASLRLEVDLQALSDNWRTLGKLSGEARAGAAVKADAYGLGARRVVPALLAAGCKDFFVAHWQEAAALRDLAPPSSIAVLHGTVTQAEAAFAIASGFRPVLNSLQQVKEWLAAGGGQCHVMVETGINRLGLSLAELSDPVCRQLDIDLLMSHLACADEESPENARQLMRWQEARQLVPHRRASLANSAGITLGTAYHGDLTRPGLALYGGVPCPALSGLIKQVARPQVMLLQIRELETGDRVGYNGAFVAEGPIKSGIVSLGYADGYLRAWSGRGTLRHHGAALPVLGRISMDMTVIDLSEAPYAYAGAWIDVDYDLPQAAQVTGLSQYELLTVLGERFSR